MASATEPGSAIRPGAPACSMAAGTADELTSPSLALLREPLARRNWQEDHRSSESFGESQRLKKEIPTAYQRHLDDRHRSILKEGGQARSLTFRGFWVGSFLSFFLAIGAPYGNMIIRGSYMALDFSTPGAIFLFLLLIGLLNLLFKLAGKGTTPALLFALAAAAGWIYAYAPFEQLDPYSPGLIFSTFIVVSALMNIPVALRGGSLALNR